MTTQPVETQNELSRRPSQGLSRLFFVLMAFGVGCGAFGAHALRDIRTPQQIETWKTATLYLLVHALAGTVLSLISSQSGSTTTRADSGDTAHGQRLFVPQLALALFALGCFFFAGSLYALVLTEIRILGAITPIGGVMFISAWLILALKTRRN